MKKERKKVLIFANNDIWLYKLRKEIVLELLKEGYEVVLSSPNGDYIQTMVNWGCSFIETKVDRRGTNPLKDLQLFVSYLKVLKKVKPDIVLTYTIKPNLYGGLACRILSIPYINNITGLGSGFSKNPILKFIITSLYKFSLRKSTSVFFQNTEDMKTLIDSKIVTGPAQLIPGSGVNLQEYEMKAFPKEEDASFIFIGRIMKDKGIDQYLEAAKAIKMKYPKTTFRIVGFIEETQPHYRNLIKEYEEKGYISFLGFQADVKPFIEKSHCLVQPSHGGEGMSNVLLETAATGRALIASDIPGCRETIEEGRNGYVFKPKNSQSLVEKIETYITLSPSEKKQMGLNSRLKIEKQFDRDIVVKAYLDQIQKL
nr:glycosyltransferase family 4 protein [Planomicrobium okeanokoites]